MRFRCRSCGTLNQIESPIPSEGKRIRCRGCGKVNLVRPRKKGKDRSSERGPEGGDGAPRLRPLPYDSGEEAETRMVSGEDMDRLLSDIRQKKPEQEQEPFSVVDYVDYEENRDYGEEPEYEPVMAVDYEQGMEKELQAGDEQVDRPPSGPDGTGSGPAKKPLPANPDLGDLLFSDSVMERMEAGADGPEGQAEGAAQEAGPLAGTAESQPSAAVSRARPSTAGLPAVLNGEAGGAVTMGQGEGHGAWLVRVLVVFMVSAAVLGGGWWALGTPTDLDGLYRGYGRLERRAKDLAYTLFGEDHGRRRQAVAGDLQAATQGSVKSLQAARDAGENEIHELLDALGRKDDTQLSKRLDELWASAVQRGCVQEMLVYHALASATKVQGRCNDPGPILDAPLVNMLWRSSPGLSCSRVALTGEPEHALCSAKAGLIDLDLSSGKARVLARDPSGEPVFAYCRQKGMLAFWKGSDATLDVVMLSNSDDSRKVFDTKTDIAVETLVFSKDCSELLVAGKGRAFVTVLDTGRRKPLKTKGRNIEQGVFTDKGGLYLATDHGELLVAGPKDKVVKRTGSGLGGPWDAISFSQSSRAFGIKGSKAYLIDLDKGTADVLPVPIKDGISLAVVSSDGKRAATIERSGRFLLWMLESDVRARIQEHAGGVRAVAMSRHGDRLAWSTWFGDMVVHDLLHRKRLLEVRGPGGGLVSIRFDASGNELFAACRDGTVRAFKRDTGLEKYFTPPGLKRGLEFAEVLPGDGSGKYEVAVSDGEKVVVLEPETGGTVRKVDVEVALSAVSREAGRLAVAPRLGKVKVLDVKSLEVLAEVGRPWAGPRSLEFGAAGGFLAVGYARGDVGVFYKTGEEIWRHGPAGSAVKGVAFLAHKGILAYGNSSGRIGLWVLSQGVEMKSLDAGAGLTSLDVSRDGRWLAAGLVDGRVALWDTENDFTRYFIEASSCRIDDIAFSPAESVLAVVGGNGCAALFRVGPPEENQELLKLEGEELLGKVLRLTGLKLNPEDLSLEPREYAARVLGRAGGKAIAGAR